MMRTTLIVAAVLAVAGCSGEEHQDLKAWMHESTKDLKGKVPPLPEIKPFPVVAYDALELVSPFNPVKLVPDKKTGGNGPAPDLNRRREPLEAYPLESLKMVGSLMQGRQQHAIVLADKSYYQVQVGNYMGQNFGVVTAISENEINLKELVEDANGDWVERTTALQLQETKK